MGRYYLVFYHEIRPILDKVIHFNGCVQYTQYADFYEIKEIGSGGYRTVYTAKHKQDSVTIVLTQFKNFDQIKMQELFINEVRNNNNW